MPMIGLYVHSHKCIGKERRKRKGGSWLFIDPTHIYKTSGDERDETKTRIHLALNIIRLSTQARVSSDPKMNWKLSGVDSLIVMS